MESLHTTQGGNALPGFPLRGCVCIMRVLRLARGLTPHLAHHMGGNGCSALQLIGNDKNRLTCERPSLQSLS